MQLFLPAVGVLLTAGVFCAGFVLLAVGGGFLGAALGECIVKSKLKG